MNTSVGRLMDIGVIDILEVSILSQWILELGFCMPKTALIVTVPIAQLEQRVAVATASSNPLALTSHPTPSNALYLNDHTSAGTTSVHVFTQECQFLHWIVDSNESMWKQSRLDPTSSGLYLSRI